MIDAKMSFLRQVEKECADKLTVTDMGSLMQTVSNVLQRFRMEELQCQDMFSMEMLQFFTKKHLESMEAWADEAIALLKEQQKLIDEITQRRANNGAFD